MERACMMSELCYLGAISRTVDRKWFEHARQKIPFLIHHGQVFCSDTTNRLNYFWRQCLRFCLEPLLDSAEGQICKVRVDVGFPLRRRDPEAEHCSVLKPFKSFTANPSLVASSKGEESPRPALQKALLTTAVWLQKESLLTTSTNQLLGTSSGPECRHSGAQQPGEHKDSPHSA